MKGKKPQNAEEYWENIGGQVLLELEERLSMANSAKELPGTLLMRLAEKYLAYLEKQASKEEQEVTWLTPMEAIDQEGLPLNTKIQILMDYMIKLDEDKILAQAKLEELKQEVVNGSAPLHEQESPE